MKSDEIRKRFISFFKNHEHKLVEPASLKTDDPSVLLTTAGMQQFKEYYTGKKNPEKDFKSKNLISIQPCFRTSDIDEVGDESHLTLFEMLGNFSFDGYFKDDAIKMAYEFFNELGIDKQRMFVTIFEGENGIPRDEESEKIWKKLSMMNIKMGKGKDNFWGPTGDEGPCGPTTEIYVDGCEIWNIVFNEYLKDKNGKFHPLEQKGVDTGMGLERLAMVMQGKKNVFETDLFLPIIEKIKELKVVNKNNEKAYRIIADHIRGSVFLIKDGVRPSNVEEGYILRRVLRRAIRYGKLLLLKGDYLQDLVDVVVKIYGKHYELNKNEIIKVIHEEYNKFESSLDKGLKEFNKRVFDKKISGKEAFLLYQSYGFPLELTKDLAEEKKLKVDEKEFYEEFEKHQNASRGKSFKSGLADKSDNTVKLHTASHLLLQALNDVLTEDIQQKGSNITPERLRFDFNFPRKLTDKEIKQVEEIVNEKIKEKLDVEMEEMPYAEAVKRGFRGAFEAKYPQVVSCYSMGNYSREICTGPHVRNTKELGKFKIVKEESSSGGIRRIRAVLE